MAFDGITIANIVCELNAVLTSGGISRIIQPEKDELYLTVKNSRTNFVLYMSASASLPLVYLAGEAPKASLTAPNFCMILLNQLACAVFFICHTLFCYEWVLYLSARLFPRNRTEKNLFLLIPVMMAPVP